jgi:chromatin segregation and condensation protein Rec8/ScpA/Scc1 (kleisin family)
MPRTKYKRPLTEPGVLSNAVVKRFRRTEARQRQTRTLNDLKIQYLYKVRHENKSRADLQDIEEKIKKLTRTLNHRGKFDFDRIFTEQPINVPVSEVILLPISL